MFDPELYRPKEEVEAWKKQDPIDGFVGKLQEADLLSDDELEALKADAEADVDEAVAFAEAGTLEPVSDLTRFVYSEDPAEEGS
jgi:TPP-dependent pyruvate/acetoin dehydrogenase alpha subunit